MSTEIILVREAMQRLSIRDSRTFQKWCNKNNVTIFSSENGTGKQFVYELQFELAKDMPLISNLKNGYGNDWYYAYLAYKQHDIVKIAEMLSHNKNGFSKEYKPQSKYEKEFLADLTQTLSKLS